MATSYDRRINLYINDKEIKNDIVSIRKEFYKATNEMSRMTVGSDEYNKKMKEVGKLKGIMDQHTKGIRAAAGATKENTGAMSNLLGMAKGLLPAFSFAAIAGAAKLAFGQIVSATDTLGTKWDVFTGGLREGMNEFWRSIATGDFSNLIDNMSEAVRVGREYQIVLDELEARQRALSVAEADSRMEILTLEDIVRNVTKTDEERVAAAERRIEIEEELAAKRTKIAKQEYENELMMTAQATKLSKERLIAIIADMDSETKVKAEAYNVQMVELKRLEAEQAKTGAATGVLFPGMQSNAGSSARIAELKAETATTSGIVKDYAQALSNLGNATDDQLNKLVETYSGVKNAEVSTLENTRRVRSTMYSVLEQMAIESKKTISKTLNIKELIEADPEIQKAAIEKYFTEAGEGAIEAFIAAIEKKQNEAKIDFSMVPETPEEKEQNNPALDYALQQYQETIDFKLALNESMYVQGLIGEEQYQDQLTALTRQAENERYEIKRSNIEKASQMANLSANFITALMDFELQKAGENEEKKKAIRKKYADINFAVTAAQIIADTAAAIMKGFAELGPIGGAISAALLGATGLVQLGIANAQRKEVKGYAAGGYAMEEQYVVAEKNKPEWIGPNWMTRHPATAPAIANLERLRRKGPTLSPLAVSAFSDGGFTSHGNNQIQIGSGPAAGENSENKILFEMMNRISHSLDNNTAATRNLMEWQPSVSVETFERRMKSYVNIQRHSGLGTENYKFGE